MITYRSGTAADARVLFEIFEAAIDDLSERLHVNGNSTAGDPDAWQRRRPLYEHLSETAEHLWIAEDDGRAVGYARSILRDGVRELTELFVRPELQSAGIGRELLERAFPSAGARHRTLLATMDARAMARYLRAGLDGRLSVHYVSRAPEQVTVASDLRAEPLVADPETLARLAEIDREILGYRRDVDHRWFAAQRRGQIYRRGAAIVAYGYAPVAVGWGGPYAALAAEDLPRLLADAESAAHRAGHAEVGFDVALINRRAFDYLLGRGYRIQPFSLILFSDAELGRYDRYVFCSPSLIA